MKNNEPLPIPGEPERSDEYDFNAAVYDQLAGRLDELEGRLTGRLLTAEDKERDLRLQEIEQRMAIRRWTARLAALTVVMMCLLVGWTKYSYGLMWLILAPKAYVIALIVAPILSVTTITVALLLGAFRRFKDDDPEQIATTGAPLGAALKNVIGQ